MQAVATPRAVEVSPVSQHVRHSSRGLLKLVTREGAAAQVYIAFTGGAFLAGLAILLGVNDFQMGLLAALPFLAQAAQLISPYLIERLDGRKRLTLTALTFGRLVWLPVIPLLFVAGTWRIYVLFALITLSAVSTMVATPAWFSWMSDLIPRGFRGRYLATRSAVIAAVTLIVTVGGSILIDIARKHQWEPIGFALLLGSAVAVGLVASRTARRLPDTASTERHPRFAWKSLSLPLRDWKFLKLQKAFFVWNFAIGIGAAFFVPHMLLNLNMSFIQIGLYSGGATVVAILANRPWGILIDRFGPRAVLVFCSVGIGAIPLVWLFPRPDLLWILIPETIYSGFLWTGFNLAAFTIPIDRSPRAERPGYLAMFAVVTGMAFFLGSVLGGALADYFEHLTVIIGSQTLVNYHVLFVLSAILRLIGALLLSLLRSPAEIRLPFMIQLMGYAVLKRLSLGRQISLFAAGADETDDSIHSHHH